ncbi:MAG: hypothetical protein CMG63_04460 [Candidatus Marinimicrobia bacterium]|nr:hypothetical protein [Candidatus Neomarinimicrobiota bacterium]
MKVSIKSILTNYSESIINYLDNIFSGDKWIIYGVLLSTFVSLFFAFPSYDSIDPSYRRLSHFIEQYNNIEQYWISHPISNINYRITVPIIVDLFNASYVEAFIFQFICGMLLFFFSIRLIHGFTGDRISAILFSLALSLSIPGIMSFCELRGIFDGVAIFFIVLALYLNKPILISSSIFLGSFTDERAFFASGFLLAYGLIKENENNNLIKRLMNKYNSSVIIGMAIYLITRYIITTKYGLKMQDVHDLGLVGWKFLDQINNIPIAIWTALEGLWLLPITCIILTFNNKSWDFNIFYVGTLIFFIIMGNSVVDTTRSLIYLFPSTIVAMKIISNKFSKRDIRYLLMICLLICFIWPAYGVGGKSSIWWQYPLPMQILRWVFL